MNLLRSLCVVALGMSSLTASAGVMLTADVYDTPGLPGYQTFDLTASASTGYLNGFDFTRSGLGGVTGPLHQGAAPSDDPWASYGADTLFGGLSGDAADSHWLVNSSDGFAVQSSQSSDELGAAFVFGSASGRRDSHRSLPFARIVTNDPSAVSLDGQFLVEQYWSDGGGAGTTMFDVNTTLADISTADAPDDTTFPDRPIPPVVEAPVVEPPAVAPPTVEPPTITPPALPEPPFVGLPVVDPILVEPVAPPVVEPVVIPPVVEPPTVEPSTVSIEEGLEELGGAVEVPHVQPVDPVVLPVERPQPETPTTIEEVVIDETSTLPEVLVDGDTDVWRYPFWQGRWIDIDFEVSALPAIDTTTAIDTTSVYLNFPVPNRGVLPGEVVLFNAIAYDGDAIPLSFATNAVADSGLVPEPTTVGLAMLALCGAVGCRRR